MKDHLSPDNHTKISYQDCHLESEMGNEVARSNTYVANATSNPLRIYYSTERMLLEEIVLKSCTSCDDCEKQISENFYIPGDRSFIVTANHSIRFQKYGASIWEDEDGIRH
ncbi:hypothetical protein JZ751_016278, partial [Albula glossodonta]